MRSFELQLHVGPKLKKVKYRQFVNRISGEEGTNAETEGKTSLHANRFSGPAAAHCV